MAKKIAFQGELGAYGHQACAETYPEYEPLPCPTFETAIAAVKDGDAELGMIAVENSTYGRVADVHSLLPGSGLHIIAEAFVRVHVNLLGKPGTAVSDIKEALGHVVILPQCAAFLRENAIKPVVSSDNARAARDVAEGSDPSKAALASELAAQYYGLEVLARHIEDNANNTTRFLVMADQPDLSRRAGDAGMMTSFLFRVRNIPAALYKAMGGFATNSVNMTKLESYMGNGFAATEFYAEIVGHPDDDNVRLALEELDYFTDKFKLLGVYPAAKARHGQN